MRAVGCLGSCFSVVLPVVSHAQSLWPSLDKPAAAVGGGEADGAVIIAIERYGFMPPVPGAVANGLAWHDYFEKTRGTPSERVSFLRNEQATIEEIRARVARTAELVLAEGKLWIVFVGHGLPAKSGTDGLLVGFDAQQREQSAFARSLPQSELIGSARSTKAGNIVIILDACFSGRATGSDEPLLPGLQPVIVARTQPVKDGRVVVLSAGGGDEFAGPLAGSARPAFSYLALGALRGWVGVEDGGGISAGAVRDYAWRALAATLPDRTQTPGLFGQSTVILAESARERGPDLSKIQRGLGSGTLRLADLKGGNGETIVITPKRGSTVRSEGGARGAADGTVAFESTPPGMRVWIDGRELPGRTPVEEYLRMGRHKIRIGGEQTHRDHESRIELRDGMRVAVELEPIVGDVVVVVRDENGQLLKDVPVYLDGKAVAKAPVTLGSVLIGSHRIRTSAPHGAEYEQAIQVVRAKRTRAELTLLSPGGWEARAELKAQAEADRAAQELAEAPHVEIFGKAIRFSSWRRLGWTSFGLFVLGLVFYVFLFSKVESNDGLSALLVIGVCLSVILLPILEVEIPSSTVVGWLGAMLAEVAWAVGVIPALVLMFFA